MGGSRPVDVDEHIATDGLGACCGVEPHDEGCPDEPRPVLGGVAKEGPPLQLDAVTAVLERDEDWDTDHHVGYSLAAEDGGRDPERVLALSRSDWNALGRPAEVTVTVARGDRLNPV